MTLICVPIVQKTFSGVLRESIKAQKAGADLVEIWLGELKEPALPDIFQNLALPALVNCKGTNEGGSFSGTDSEKVKLLTKAAELGAVYTDLDAKTDQELLRQFRKKKGKCRLILSAHFWKNTPSLPSLLLIVEAMQKNGADIVKIAATPKQFQDVVTIIRLAENLSRKNIPHIVISMGQMGKITRIASPLLQNECMFAVIDAKKLTAPGQITVKKLAQFFKEW